MVTYDTIPAPNKRPLSAETDIIELQRKPEGTLIEEDFKNVLRRYNLRDGLIALGNVSKYIFNSENSNKIGQVAYREPETGIIVSQFALAYLANILLISGANDYRSKYISQKDNWLSLCYSYSNGLADPLLAEDSRVSNKDRFRSFMIRTYTEQRSYQFSPLYMIARTIVIFDELTKSIQPDKIEPLSEIFQRETDLNIYDYLRLCFAIFALTKRRVTFDVATFTKANIPQFKDLLTEEKMIKLIDVFKADYWKFRKQDTDMNKKLDPLFTKTRFNPLQVYPIIEVDAKHLGYSYVIPNIMTYVKRAFGGLYWWFHRYFEDKKEQQYFRDYFGHVFQEYVGKILKGIYGSKSVHGEISYGKSSNFIDWWVERDDKIYLFESKAYQFALLSKQTGDREIVTRNEIKKITEAITQVYKRMQDIQKYEELKRFRGKTIVPFIIFMDVPFVSDSLYKLWIKEALWKIEQKKKIPGLKDSSIFLLNIEDLELYDEVVDTIALEDVFQKFKGDTKKSFLSTIGEVKGKNLRNRYLDRIIKDFWKTGFGVLVDKKK